MYTIVHMCTCVFVSGYGGEKHSLAMVKGHFLVNLQSGEDSVCSKNMKFIYRKKQLKLKKEKQQITHTHTHTHTLNRVCE